MLIQNIISFIIVMLATGFLIKRSIHYFYRKSCQSACSSCSSGKAFTQKKEHVIHLSPSLKNKQRTEDNPAGL